MTLFHNMIESSKDSQYWADNALIQAVIGNWFAASLDYSKISKLPILDSFIKETIRVNPVDKSELF